MDEPTDEEAPKPRPAPDFRARLAQWWESNNGPIWVLPFVCWSVFGVYVWSYGVPLWQAIPLGILSSGVGCAAWVWMTNGELGSALEWLLGWTVPLALAFVVVPFFAQARRDLVRKEQCLQNVKEIGVALRMYASDNDERWPPAPHWSDAAYLYINEKALPYIPTIPKAITGPNRAFWCPSGESSCGYAFNAALSGAESRKIPTPNLAPLVYDSTAGIRNARDALASLPRPGRHNKGNIIGYADGHARWVKDGATP